eukprot:TRINITY_DN98_c0_g1_i6.p1 TRINITY_DN98_c0_g1~~TRINITY_DN98_c0_g1_i6.p1  ORF type:complete len:724 (+),score=445.54 TRINITY_DN98_c0_g1_i6:43-2172(+)
MSFKEFFDSRVVDSLRHVHVDLDGLYALLVSARRQSSDADMRQTGALWARDDLLASGEREFLLAWDGELTRVRAVIDAQAGELTTALSAIERRAAHTDGNTRDADALAKRVVALERFVSLNYDALRHLAALQSRGAPSALLTRLNESLALCDVFEQLLLTLSRVYTALRVSAGDASESDESDIADDQRAGADGVFVRATTKYLVRPDDVFGVKCRVAAQLPVLLFDRAARSDSSCITSVYFDNDDHEAYSCRMAREEGATLLRVRWYGDGAARDGGRSVFVERKTHHENWVRTQSVKERFSLHEKLVPPLADGSLPRGELAAALGVDGKAKRVPRPLRLALELQEEFAARRFVPTLRTCYRRAAFQRARSNQVRISIDTELLLVDERTLVAGHAADSDGSAWRTAHGRVPPRAAVRFPFAILEVKLAGADAPAWIGELVRSGLLQEAPKFSKFLHGSATHFGVPELPPWWHELRGARARLWNDDDDRRAARRFAEQHDRAGDEMRSADDESDSGDASGERANGVFGHHHDDNDAVADDGDVQLGVRQRRTGAQNKKKNDDADADDDDDERALAAFSTQPLRLPVKIEPKVFFANERTFLQWLNTLLLLAVGSSAFVAYGSTPFQVAGTLLVVVSLVFVLYALAIYHWRRRAIVRRLPTRAYDDRYGPTALVALVVVTFVLSVLLQFVVEPQSMLQEDLAQDLIEADAIA